MTKYLIIDLKKGHQTDFRFDDLYYSLSQDEVTCLIENGVLHQLEPEIPVNNIDAFADSGYGCHRCRQHFRRSSQPATCPHCYSNTWNMYTLLYCCECHALFEYYWHLMDEPRPYNRFPRCPACKSEHWCRAENERLKSLPSKEEMQAQAEAKRQQEAEAFTRIMEFRKRQELKKLGLRQPSLQAEEKGAAIPEAEAYYTSAQKKNFGSIKAPERSRFQIFCLTTQLQRHHQLQYLSDCRHSQPTYHRTCSQYLSSQLLHLEEESFRLLETGSGIDAHKRIRSKQLPLHTNRRGRCSHRVNRCSSLFCRGSVQKYILSVLSQSAE